MFFSKIFPMLTDTVTYTESCLEKIFLLVAFFLTSEKGIQNLSRKPEATEAKN